MKITFDDKSFIQAEVNKANNKIDITVAALDGDKSMTLISVEMSKEQLQQLVGELLK